MGKYRLLKLAAGIALINSVLPALYHKRWNPAALRKTKRENAIMLTFDDGPDERYTGELLDILRLNKIRASFFIVTNQAKKNPELIRRMIEENHVVGFHSLEHKSEMLHSYCYTKREFDYSVTIMKHLGAAMHFYRPPWGQANLFSYHFAKKNGMRMVLWNVMAEDWREDATVEGICEKLRERVKAGSIICLHDAGEHSGGALDAPLKTIQALRILIPEWKRKGYQFITPEEEFSGAPGSVSRTGGSYEG